MILLFVAQKGLATFFVNKVSLVEFLFSGDWSPSEGKFGALPMILGSFVTLLSALVATPFAIGAAIFMTEISPKGAKFLQPAIELFGWDSICCLWIYWSQVVVPFVRLIFWWNRFWYSFRYFVLFVMILPTVTFMTTDTLRAVPRHYREASLEWGLHAGKRFGV